jgi:hypothetical protein
MTTVSAQPERLRWRIGLLVAATAMCVLLAAAPSHADQASVALGSVEPELTPADDGGGTAKIALTNLTDAPVDITPRPQTPPNPNCTVQLDHNGQLPAARSLTFTATIAAACGRITKSFPILVEAAGKDLPVITATVKTAKKPDWDVLSDWFVTSMKFALGLMVAVYLLWWIFLGGSHPFTALPSLDKSWSFNDSWVTNVTVVGGLLAGIFGSSDVVTAILGGDADEAVALATIGGAVSVALIGAAGVVVIAAKVPATGQFTVIGVLVGSALALGAAAGQLGVVYESARDLELGGIEDDLMPFLVGALILLGVYGLFSVLGVLIQGHAEPEEEDPAEEPVSEPIFAAAVIAASVIASVNDDHRLTRDEVDQVLKDLAEDKRTKVLTEAREEPAPRAVKSRGISTGATPTAARPAALP